MVFVTVQSQLRCWNTWIYNYDGNFYGFLFVFWREASCMDGYWSANDVLRSLLWCYGKGYCRDMHGENGLWHRGKIFPLNSFYMINRLYDLDLPCTK